MSFFVVDASSPVPENAISCQESVYKQDEEGGSR
jgi:hypothetical protein